MKPRMLEVIEAICDGLPPEAERDFVLFIDSIDSRLKRIEHTLFGAEAEKIKEVDGGVILPDRKTTEPEKYGEIKRESSGVIVLEDDGEID
jgi:hypothetical protein